MRTDTFKLIRHTACAAFTALLMASGGAFANVTLTASATQATLPDGQSVPMWGYTCGAPTSGETATCVALNPNAGSGWSPVVITVPYMGPATSLTISLTNNLPAPVPTSVVIVGQLGGGLGGAPTTTLSPVHAPQGPTWPIAGPAGGDPTFTPPAQGPRVQSFGTEVAAGGSAATLTWNNLKPGTYLIESGTHPSIQGPMGLYGVLVVTAPPAGGAGTAYPAAGTTAAVTYNAEVPLLLSEIDPVQNAAVAAAVATTGFSETAVWSGQPGRCGNPASPTYRTCYPPAVNYDPRYYLINGVSFDKTGTNASRSLFATTPATATGTVLVRFVNAGLRMHVPSIVGAQTGSPAASGFSLVAEDGNVLPGKPRIQNEVFLAAGKTYDVLMNAPTGAPPPSLAVFDRQLSLSTNNQRDGGMQGYIGVNGSGVPAGTSVTAAANPDTYYLVSGNTITVAESAKGVTANDIGVYGVQVLTAPTAGTLTMNPDGTFIYVPNAGTTSDSFSYCANGTVSGTTCSTGLTATVTLAACTGTCLGAAPMANADSYTSNIASRLQISPPGVLANDTDPDKHPLTVDLTSVMVSGSITVNMNADGSFTATAPAPGPYTFTYKAKNSQGTLSSAATVTLNFPTPSNLAVTLKDGPTGTTMPNDYRWIIEEDRSFLIDPATQTNSGGTTPVPSLGTNFHTSHMPVVAQGCVGTISCEAGQTLLGVAAVCDQGNGVCRTDASQKNPVNPNQVYLDPTKRYYISILPGDAANGFNSGAGSDPATDCGTYVPGGKGWDPANPANSGSVCGHGLGGAPIAPGQTSVNVTLEQTPLPTAKITVFVFEDDQPLNGENDAGGGVDILAPNEPGLGGFEITLFDQAGQLGDATGQITYDMFNMPVSNSLAGTIDPATGKDACPIAKKPTADPTQQGVVGMIVTCPKYESDGTTLSPLAGQAVIANMYPGLYEVVATPAAERIAKGEEWLQTNTLDGTKPLEAFIKPGEPAYFQEFGPAGFHVSIGFANPAIINNRKHNTAGTGLCDAAPNGGGLSCTNSVSGTVTTTRLSRTPDQRLYSSGNNAANSFTQCYVSLGDPDDEDFAFTKCDADGKFSFSGLPDGNWRITVFDQWNDLLVDGLSTPVALHGGQNLNMGDVSMQHWRTNFYTRTFLDQNGDGVSQDNEAGLALVPTNIRYRDGSIGLFNNTDLNGFAGYNEIFPFVNWLVIEADSTRYKQTGVHVVYDAGGPADNSPSCSAASPCGSSTIADHLANTFESPTAHLPSTLRFPGSVYCNDADCTDRSGTNPSTGRVDPPWVTTEAWQALLGAAEFVEFGKAPYAAGENGGIRGEVNYASTRPFDDPSLLLQLSWAPNVPNVTVNLYQKSTAPDGTESLKLVDTTKTSSWDDWAQGFRSNGIPNMNCPGQETTSPFFFTLQNSQQYLNPGVPLPNASQFKCYDGWAINNQVQPAPYDGMYQFPSIIGRNPQTGVPTGTGATNGTPGSVAGTNCTICVANPTDGTPMLPTGKYVVEVIVPPGYELVKEEDKNILIGDNMIAPVTQQFAGLGSVFILPDQAMMNSVYNANSSVNPTTNLGATPRHEGDTGSVEAFWPCVGAKRIVPDFISEFPVSAEVAPFAGASRNLCDRKEVTLEDQMSALAKFYIFSGPHVAAHFSGVVNDDFASEFDPFSPQFGEKFAVPNVPISIKDWAGNEISRVYSDQWGAYNGVTYSSWSPNPPNPTGYAPAVMVMCMNDPGPIPDPAHPGQMMTDPLYNSNYSDFCYEWSFMPGQTSYLDTPVVPTAAFAEGYNTADCAYPDTTPGIKSVAGDTSGGGAGPWVSAATHILTITALGDQLVPNNAYSGPQSTAAPFNQKFITRHYGFGATQGTGSVTIAGVNAQVTSWSDTQIQVRVPNIPTSASTCTIAQRGVSGSQAANYRCGELVVTAGNGKKSIDAVTVTVAGKAPTYVSAGQSIQAAIDSATPGDLIIVGPGSYNEMLLMWKPVRLQGVGAESVTINANAHPAGKLLDPWRRKVVCLFGLDPNGQPAGASYPGCTVPSVSGNPMQIDRIPLEGIIGWDTSTNGNLAELLAEPTLMGAYEGAAITVLAKGVRIPAGTLPNDAFGAGAEAGFPAGTRLLTNSNADCNAFSSNFLCNPSRIDGLTITNSSQGGGGIFLHGWSHFTEISNNRIHGNAGTLTGGITIGQGEFPDPNIVGDADYDPLMAPQFNAIANFINRDGTQAPYYLQHHVSVHNNSVTRNASIGDELYSATPTGAGGVNFSTGSDNYHFNYNWVCGNLSTGDGGGVVHSGFSYNGDISNNWILFNQSNNPTIPTYGGGLAILRAAPDPTINGVECGSVTDADCPPGLAEGTGPGLVIDSNLIMGNTAESGSGGGIRLQGVNGEEVGRFTGSNTATGPNNWYGVSIINNIIANNVAGWDGGGVSIEDALKVSFINNTVISNDTTASAGVLFNTLGAPLSSSPSSCDIQTGVGCTTTSSIQAAGLVSWKNTTNLASSMTTVTCPSGYGYTGSLTNGQCKTVSLPLLRNDLFWQNRAFHLSVHGNGTGLLNQQNLVTLVPQLDQTATGQCVTTGLNGTGNVVYWDIGVRGDTSPTPNSGSGFRLSPTFSILTNASAYGPLGSTHNLGSNPSVVTQYCNGARVPPENGGLGYNVDPGIADATSPNPVFNLTPSATVDEGNNWINMMYGPLSVFQPNGTTRNGNYAIATGSPAINAGTGTGAPNHDICGHNRPPGSVDIGAFEFTQSGGCTLVTP